MNELSDKTTIVVGASRGLGRGIATAIAQAGAPVVAVAAPKRRWPSWPAAARTSGPRSTTPPSSGVPREHRF